MGLRLRSAVAVDLGSARTRMWARGRGLVVDVPTTGCVDGHAVAPVRHGVVVDPAACTALVRRRLRRAGPALFGTHAVVAVPAVDGDETVDTLRAAGARRVVAVDQPLAAAIGAGVDVAARANELVVDVGAGLVEVAVVGEGRVLAQRTLPWGLEDVAEDLATRLRAVDGLVVPLQEALRAVTVGHAVGRDAATGAARTLRVAPHLEHVYDGRLDAVARAVSGALDELPATLAADVVARGIVLVGGGTAAAGLPDRLSGATRMQVHPSNNPIHAVVLGAARVLDGS